MVIDNCSDPVYADCDTAEAQSARQNLTQTVALIGKLRQAVREVGDERGVVPVVVACDDLLKVLAAECDWNLGTLEADLAAASEDEPRPPDPDQSLRRCWWFAQQCLHRLFYARAEAAYGPLFAVWNAVDALAFTRGLHHRTPDRRPGHLTDAVDQAAWTWVAGCRQKALEQEFAQGGRP